MKILVGMKTCAFPPSHCNEHVRGCDDSSAKQSLSGQRSLSLCSPSSSWAAAR